MNPMSTRSAKQLIYGTLYLLFWVAIIFGFYRVFFNHAASCFDNVQNQGEQGVDCGGPCSKVCSEGTRPISILKVSAFSVKAGHDTFLAKIANPNADSAAQSFAYAFNVYDASGTLMQSFPGYSFLYANGVRYLVAPNQVVPDGVDHYDLTITGVNWVQASSLGTIPAVNVQNIQTQVGSSTTLATGQVINNDTIIFKDVVIVGIFKDNSGNPVAASQTQIDSISPSEMKDFSVSYPSIPSINPAATEVEVYATRN
jgi:hypothetical protein